MIPFFIFIVDSVVTAEFIIKVRRTINKYANVSSIEFMAFIVKKITINANFYSDFDIEGG